MKVDTFVCTCDAAATEGSTVGNEMSLRRGLGKREVRNLGNFILLGKLGRFWNPCGIMNRKMGVKSCKIFGHAS